MANDVRKQRGRKPRRKSDVFISWSGSNSREIASALKKLLETKVFAVEKIKCFVSNQDIESGANWRNIIHSELKSCKIGIICITKENVRKPWIYYEAGAMAAQGVSEIIPLLISCSLDVLKETPLQSNQAVDFYDYQRFVKMICDIAEEMEYRERTEDEKNVLIKAQYEHLKRDLTQTLKRLRDYRLFNETYVYPNDVTTVRKNTIFVSAPMSSISGDEYKELRKSLIEICKVLTELQPVGFTEAFCPVIEKDNPLRFDGKTKAIKDNFPQMKQSDSMLIIYPRNVPSSSLVENGYGIALTKKIVIFHKEKLPYILEEAGGAIQNVKTYHYDSFSEIKDILVNNGMTLFDGDGDDL